MKIGPVAHLLDVPVHVLRHWDDVGVVVPDRTPSGHRVYTDEHLYRLQVLQACQAVGMSLPEIRGLLHRGEPGRSNLIARQLQRIRKEQEQLRTAERFLIHVLDCTHDLLTRCPQCSDYATSAARQSGINQVK
ncbi:MerR family transcriptional regulator [Rhodococcus sp. H29-C3]|uniref:MerR family transcriptional regulator n=1 Tax=Rhodococcus sp. H29-C3 TaxID=3046307 RepID=UPI0024BA7A6E|nr:MerR family transcriptional regulator [Rhodococcus sp. H29-C3]MDJ0363208.1 MerR family transcriptional regulator [Rhodococcus sp. H29-C3]